MYQCVICFLLIFVTAACAAPNQVAVTPAPTQTLIPAQPTDTSTPTTTPSPTGTEQPRPQDLALTATAQFTPDATALAFTQAQPLIQLAIEDLTGRVDDPAGDVEFARQESVTWSDAGLECEVNVSGDTDETAADETTVEGYRLLLIAGERVYEYHTDTASTVKLCLESSLYEDYADLFLERDPVAAELVGLAQQRLGRDLDFPTRRISVSSVQPIEWEDSSLGCPVEGQVYQPFTVPGYRIVLTVNETDYTYHTDFERVIACSTES